MMKKIPSLLIAIVLLVIIALNVGCLERLIRQSLNSSNNQSGSASTLNNNSGPETWILNFSSQAGAAGLVEKVSGRGRINIDSSGRLSGQAQLSATVTGTMRAGQNACTVDASGKGPAIITGKREREYLRFGFKEGAIPVRGTMECDTPLGVLKDRYETDIDPYTLAPPAGTVIERKNGAKTTVAVRLPIGNGTSVATLSGGNNVVQESDVPTVSSSEPLDPDNIWVVDFVFKGLMTAGRGRITFNAKGQAEFLAPLDGNGLIKGQGRFTDSVHLSWNGSTVGGGTLIVNGQVRNDDEITFEPRLKFEQEEGAYGLSANAGLMNGDEYPVTMDFRNGAQKKQLLWPNFSKQGATFTNSVIWKLRGKKKQKWLITHQASDLHSQRVVPGVGAGVRADWTVQTLVDIEDDSYKEGTATISMSPRPVSTPPGLFNVDYDYSVAPPYSVRGRKVGNQIMLIYPRGRNSYYHLYYWFRINRARALDILESARIPDAGNLVNQLVRRGTMSDRAIVDVPDQGTYILPLANTALVGPYNELITIHRLR